MKPTSYSKSEARYLDKNGAIISPQVVAAANRDDADVRGVRMADIARRAQSGDLPKEAWRKQQRLEAKASVMWGAASAKGGKENLTQADYGRMGPQLKEAYRRIDVKYLKALTNEEYFQSETFVSESASYSNEGVVSHEIAREAAEIEAGYIYEFNRENPNAEHCKPKGGKESCGMQTAKGIVAIGGLVRWGTTAYNNHCRCERHRFKTMAEAEAALNAMKSIEPRFYAHGGYVV